MVDLRCAHYQYWNGKGQLQIARDIGDINTDFALMFKIIDKKTNAEHHIPIITMVDHLLQSAQIRERSNRKIEELKKEVDNLVNHCNTQVDWLNHKVSSKELLLCERINLLEDKLEDMVVAPSVPDMTEPSAPEAPRVVKKKMDKVIARLLVVICVFMMLFVCF